MRSNSIFLTVSCKSSSCLLSLTLFILSASSCIVFSAWVNSTWSGWLVGVLSSRRWQLKHREKSLEVHINIMKNTFKHGKSEGKMRFLRHIISSFFVAKFESRRVWTRSNTFQSVFTDYRMKAISYQSLQQTNIALLCWRLPPVAVRR